MMTKHTPGPVEVPYLWQCQGERMTTAYRAGYQAADDRLREINKELLAALQKLVGAAACNYEMATMRYEGLFDQARVAIAKAEG